MNMIEIKKTLWVVFICLMGHIVALAQKYQVRPLDLEQVPSAVGLGVLVDVDGSVKQAGGFIVQLMPFTPDEVVDALEKKISEIASVTEMLEEGNTPEQILEIILGDFGLEITDTLPAAFQCDCSKERVSRAISTLSKKDLDDIINDGEAIEVKCQFCNKAYHFEVDELKEMRK